MRSWPLRDGKKVLYQEGTLAEICGLKIFWKGSGKGRKQGYFEHAHYRGTFPTLTGDLNYSPEFAFELSDPVTGEKISHRYKIRTTNWFLKNKRLLSKGGMPFGKAQLDFSIRKPALERIKGAPGQYEKILSRDPETGDLPA
jgi:hypothetical protein